MNDTSSRSHCVARLNLSKVSISDGVKKVSKSAFTFVDLSGSERLEKTGMEAKSSVASFEGTINLRACENIKNFKRLFSSSKFLMSGNI